jgi:HPt (histidine-containing phosphotransfer) domain-containing protein
MDLHHSEIGVSAVAATRRETPAGPTFSGLSALSPGEPALDLVHLARQTDNDPALEEELLALFDRQSASLLAKMSEADAPARQRADAAHMLRGSALAVGAFSVARAAAALEAMLDRAPAPKTEVEGALTALALAVGEARAEIARLRG